MHWSEELPVFEVVWQRGLGKSMWCDLVSPCLSCNDWSLLLSDGWRQGLVVNHYPIQLEKSGCVCSALMLIAFQTMHKHALTVIPWKGRHVLHPQNFQDLVVWLCCPITMQQKRPHMQKHVWLHGLSFSAHCCNRLYCTYSSQALCWKLRSFHIEVICIIWSQRSPGEPR